MKEPTRIKLDPSTPSGKDVKRIPLPPIYKPEWDLGQDNDDIYMPINLEKNDENNSENNSGSI